MFRPERNYGVHFDGMPGFEAHLPVPCEGGDEQNALHPGKAFTDAAA
jgi:hypothetical protein